MEPGKTPVRLRCNSREHLRTRVSCDLPVNPSPASPLGPTDVGGGLDTGALSVFTAKSLSLSLMLTSAEPGSGLRKITYKKFRKARRQCAHLLRVWSRRDVVTGTSGCIWHVRHVVNHARLELRCLKFGTWR